MKFNRNVNVPTVKSILSPDSLRRVAMISAFLALYENEEKADQASMMRVSSSTSALKRMIVAAESTPSSLKMAIDDVNSLSLILKQVKLTGDKAFESYYNANESEIKAVFFRLLNASKSLIRDKTQNQTKAFLAEYKIGESEIDDMVEEAIHEFIARTEGKTNLRGSLAAWDPTKGTSIRSWVINGVGKRLDSVVHTHQDRIVAQSFSLNAQGVNDKSTGGDNIAAPTADDDEKSEFESDDMLSTMDGLMESFMAMLPPKIADQPPYIKELLNKGRKALEAQMDSNEDPELAAQELQKGNQLIDDLYGNMMESFNDLRQSYQNYKLDSTEEKKSAVNFSKQTYERRRNAVIRKLVEVNNPQLARRKRMNNPRRLMQEVDDAQVEQAAPVAPKMRSIDMIKPEERTNTKEITTLDDLTAKKAELEQFRKNLLPYYYKVGAFPDSKLDEATNKRTPYALKNYGMGLMPPYRHFYSGINSPDEVEAFFSNDEEKLSTLSPTALFNKLLIEGGLKAHEEYNLDRKFKIKGTNIGKLEAARFREYFEDQVDTNPVYKPHRMALMQMLESFFMSKSGQYTEEKFEEMTRGLDSHTRVAAYEWARNELAQQTGTEAKQWADLSDDELNQVADMAWNALYPQGFRSFKLQQIDDKGVPNPKGPIMALNRWQNPEAFKKIMQEETQNVKQMMLEIESLRGAGPSRELQKTRRKHPIAYRSRFDADTPPAHIGTKTNLPGIQNPVQNPMDVPQEIMPVEEQVEEPLAVQASTIQKLLKYAQVLEEQGDYKQSDEVWDVISSIQSNG
jgi:hypothetical protein